MDDYLAFQITDYLKDGRSLDDFTDFESKVKALKLDAANAALKKYFDQSKLVLVYAGDFNKNKNF